MGISLRPQHLKRYKDIAKLLLKYGKSDLVSAAGLEESLLEEDKKVEITEKIDDLPRDLENLGPAYVKLGQFMSTRSDMLPIEYVEALERLQDKVKPFPLEQVHEIFSHETGIRFSKAFEEFDAVPIGAASIGQVHKAKLRDGKVVVVKIQRPDIREQIFEDLDVFCEVSEFLQEHTDFGKRFMIESTIKEFRKAVLRELDYKSELQNLRILAKNLAEFELIVVPEPVEDYSTSKVLTMDFIRGTKVTSISPLKKLELDGKKLAEELFKAYMKQIVIDGFYHSDPHPGNIFLTDDNRIALLDLGMVGYISAEMQMNLLHILLAIGDGRGDDIAEYTLKVGKETEFFNKNDFKTEINDLVSVYKSIPLKDLQIGKIILEITKICGKNGIYISNELAMLGKTLLNLDKVGKTLDPEFEPNEAIRRNTDDLMKKKLMKSVSSSKPYEVLLESKEFFEKLPLRVNKILDKVSNNEVELKVKSIDEVYLMNGFQKIANRIMGGLILASLIVGAALIMRIESSFNILGYPGIAMILFLAAAVGGIITIFRIFFVDERSVKKEKAT